MNATERFFVTADDVESIDFGWGRAAFTICKRSCGATRFDACLVTIQPGSGHPRHQHQDAEETAFVISGHGEQMIEDENGQPSIRLIGQGDTFYVPRKRFHATTNIAKVPLIAFVTYAPGGMEERFRRLPDAYIAPPKYSKS
jgi:oxalate decarboxylase/phosphoglucose isomerase-like protein (cupin superfamily)